MLGMSNGHRKIILVGGGKVSEHIAKVMSERKHKVCIIEKDEKKAKELATKLDCMIIHGDGTDLLTLKDAGIVDCDVIVALTNDDKSNLMVCEIAKSFNIPKIIALVNKPGNEELFIKLGIGDVLPITQTITNILENLMFASNAHIIAEMGDGAVKVVECVVSDSSKFAKKYVGNIKDFVIGCIWREGSVIIPNPKTKIMPGDLVLVIVESKKLEKVLRELRG